MCISPKHPLLGVVEGLVVKEHIPYIACNDTIEKVRLFFSKTIFLLFLGIVASVRIGREIQYLLMQDFCCL